MIDQAARGQRLAKSELPLQDLERPRAQRDLAILSGLGAILFTFANAYVRDVDLRVRQIAVRDLECDLLRLTQSSEEPELLVVAVRLAELSVRERSAAANVLSGFFLRALRYRMFSMVVAGVNCMYVPFGTILGVFTLIVLARDSVAKSYDDAAGQQPRVIS